MTTATKITLGEIKLAGDLAGGTDGLNPQLTATGVVPGSYSLPSFTVDNKGRILSAANTTIDNFVQTATTAQKGIVQIGSGINVNNGVISVTPVPTASSTVAGIAKFGTGLTISNGTVSVATASTSVPGLVQIGSGINVNNGVISVTPVPTASSTVAGIAKFGTGLTISNGTVSVNTSLATSTTPGFIKLGANITADASGNITANPIIPTASSTVAGVFKVGTGLSISSGVLSALKPLASSTVIGGFRLGDGLSMLSDVLSLKAASDTSLGGIKLGGNIRKDGFNNLVIPTATTSVAGVVKPGAGFTISGDGTLSTDATYLSAATSTTYGLVKGLSTGFTGINISTDGVISGNVASPSGGIGMVQIGSGITVSEAGVISITGLSNPVLKDTQNSYSVAQVYVPSIFNFTAHNGTLTAHWSVANIFKINMIGSAAKWDITGNFNIDANISGSLPVLQDCAIVTLVIAGNATAATTLVFQTSFTIPVPVNQVVVKRYIWLADFNAFRELI